MILETQGFLLNFNNFVYNKLCCVYASSLFPKYSIKDLFSQNMEKHPCFKQVSFLMLLRPAISQVSKHFLKCKLLLSLTVAARTHASVVLLLFYWQHQKWSTQYSDDFWVNKFHIIFTFSRLIGKDFSWNPCKMVHLKFPAVFRELQL